MTSTPAHQVADALPSSTHSSRPVDHEEYLVPLFVGVVGHRDVDRDDPRLRETMEAELYKLRAQAPATPFVVLSPLAEGADRIVARIAMERLGARLVAVLPLQEDDYAADFTGGASQEEFRDLLSRAVVRTHVGLNEGPRVGNYARAGAHTVEHCQVLVAVWDGNPARGTGGTAHVVDWMLKGTVPDEFRSVREATCSVAAPQPGIVIHINPQTYQVQWLGATVTNADDSVIAPVERLNQEVRAFLRRHGTGPLQAAALEMLRSGPAQHDPGPVASVVPVYAAADRLAAEFGRRANHAVWWVVGLAVVAAACYTLYAQADDWPFLAHRPGSVRALALLHAAALLAIVPVVFAARSMRFEDRFLDYRALAEGLRVLVFWRLAGVRRNVSQNYLAKHAGVLAWIPQAIKNLESLAGSEGTTAAALPAAVVQRLWVDQQAAYFATRAAHVGSRYRRMKWITEVSFAVTFAVALLSAGAVAFAGADGGDATFIKGAKVLVALLAVVAIGIKLIQEKRAYDELRRRYELAHRVFSRASDRLNGGCDPQAVFAALGTESLIENGDWLWIHRHLPLQVPRDLK